MGCAKALLRFRGETFLDHLVGLVAVHCNPVIVVLGHEAEAVRRAMKRDAVIVVNQEYQRGQFSSMQAGLHAVPAEAPGVLFTLVDHPDPAPATIGQLFSPALISVPVAQGRKGHPVFFQSCLITEFLSLPADSDARLVFREHASETRYVNVEDAGILDDVDDPEALRAFEQRTSAGVL